MAPFWIQIGLIPITSCRWWRRTPDFQLERAVIGGACRWITTTDTWSYRPGHASWLRRDEWRAAFEDLMDEHLGEACEAIDGSADDLASLIGAEAFMVLTTCSALTRTPPRRCAMHAVSSLRLHQLLCPPSAAMTAPVMNEDSSLTRCTRVGAISSGVANRLMC